VYVYVCLCVCIPMHEFTQCAHGAEGKDRCFSFPCINKRFDREYFYVDSDIFSSSPIKEG
jgi:hypothetical protein